LGSKPVKRPFAALRVLSPTSWTQSFRKARQVKTDEPSTRTSSRSCPPRGVFSCRNSELSGVFSLAEPIEWGSEHNMQPAIAGIVLLVGMGVAPALAWDGDRGMHRDIRHDEAKIAHDRRELRRDLRNGNYAAARHERRELRREYRDVNRDRRELYRDRY